MISRFTMLLVGAAIAVALLTVAGLARAQACETVCEQLFSGAPFLSSTNPADNVHGVDPDANIKAKFSEKMLKSSINGQTFRLYKWYLDSEDVNDPGNPYKVSASVSYNKRKKLATLNPSGRLEANIAYTFVVEGADDTDGLAVKDRADNEEMATDDIRHFSTDGD
jgi:Bacterial Ig-like domain